jgi:hypothetical protein
MRFPIIDAAMLLYPFHFLQCRLVSIDPLKVLHNHLARTELTLGVQHGENAPMREFRSFSLSTPHAGWPP